MAQQFDLICLGTGAAASTAASACRSAGWSVAIIDKRPFGGTCALRGCDPKKVLVGAGDAVDWSRRMDGKGVRENGVQNPDLVGLLVDGMREKGIELHLNAQAESIEHSADILRLAASRGNDKLSFEAEMVVHGAGRVPEIDDLGLEAAGIEWERRGVKVNEYLQSVSNPAVYSAGDSAASGNPPLTPVAGYEGKVVAAN